MSEGDIPDLKPGRYICLSVTDEGEGMDGETLERATAPFFTTKGVGKGTGLGLSMVAGLMGQSGGKLVLESNIGKGTTATLWLPRTEDTDLPVDLPQSQTEASKVRPLSILAVDDDPLVLMNTVIMLEDLGHTPIEAHSGEDALRILKSGSQIDLVITDHAMPRMSGSQLAAKIQEQKPDLRIVLATGYAELPQGSDRSLPRLAKPFSQDDLASIIATVVNQAP